jgi:hypothetical protein
MFKYWRLYQAALRICEMVLEEIRDPLHPARSPLSAGAGDPEWIQEGPCMSQKWAAAVLPVTRLLNLVTSAGPHPLFWSS